MHCYEAASFYLTEFVGRNVRCEFTCKHIVRTVLVIVTVCFFFIFNVTVPSIKSFCSIKGHFKQRCQGKVSCVLLKNAKLK